MTSSPLLVAAKLNVTGLVIAAVGIVVQILGGVKYPPVPPGLIMLVVAAVLVAFTRWPWASLVGVIVPLFLLVGGVLTANARQNLAAPDHAGAFVGTLIQALGVGLALVAGLMVLQSAWRHRVSQS